ncbi:MAG: tyrosine-type recombinase/integrase [Bdellovibrionaceae bacterium]|nr:tyrosine-type recombinase/integrase [Pseudobdellovibrionaceae bacterium]
MSKANELIKRYSDGLPSAVSRYVLYRELTTADEWTPLYKWIEATGIQYIRSLELKGLSPGSIKTKAQRIKRFFDWAVKNKHLKCVNPIDTRILPKFRDDRSPVALTIDETQKLLKQIPRANFIGCRDRSAISLMLVHGLRINTVCNIKWSDVEKRGDTYFIHTKSKGNVMTSRPLRPDVAKQLLKLYEKTYGVQLEA